MDLAKIFKAYDVRGIYPEQIDEKTACRIGEAFAAVRKPRKIAVGRDVRNSGEKLKEALIKELVQAGVDVVDVGVITTDQLYFAVGNYGYDGGLSVTASHNPAEYNGIKFIGPQGQALSSNELQSIRDWAMSDKKISSYSKGSLATEEFLPAYINHVLSYINPGEINPLRVVANANFGAVSKSVDALSQKLSLKIDGLNWQQDGSFPKGTPNPMLQENRDETIELIKKVRPDLGVAWDADADRVFFFTGEGSFIPSCYIIALLSQEFLKKYPGSKIVHDLSVSWVIDDVVKAAGGISVVSAVGHTNIKAKMREQDAPFAAESSGHYLFRDSYYADNGIVPFLLVLQLVSKSGKSLDELVKPLMAQCFVSGEINFEVRDSAHAMQQIENAFRSRGKVDKTDGLVVEDQEWRFSVRASNTEPLLRLNAESRNQAILYRLVKELTKIISPA